MIFWICNLGRARLGDSSVSCDISAGNLQVVQLVAALKGPQEPHFHVLSLDKDAARLNSVETVNQNTYMRPLQDEGGWMVTSCLAVQDSRASVEVNKVETA